MERLPDDAKRAVKLRGDPASRRARGRRGAAESGAPAALRKPAKPKPAPPKAAPPKPTGGGNVVAVHDDDDNLDSAFAEAVRGRAGDADDEGWSAPVARTWTTTTAAGATPSRRRPSRTSTSRTTTSTRRSLSRTRRTTRSRRPKVATS